MNTPDGINIYVRAYTSGTFFLDKRLRFVILFLYSEVMEPIEFA